MTATFLHDDKIVSPDEEVDRHPPVCPACGATMWLIHFARSSSDAGSRAVRSYECKRCGALKDTVDATSAEASP